MRWASAGVLAILLAQPAWALSCMRPDIARDYAFAAESEDSYIVVKGDLFFDESALPKTDMRHGKRLPETTDIPAWLNGHSLTPDGFIHRFERDVVLRITCLASWCGATEKGEHLAFAKKEGTGFVIRLGPCGGMAYRDPTSEQEDTVTSCMRGKKCEEADGS